MSSIACVSVEIGYYICK